FFFQAEDGIRDRNVTGVQTCALPISLSPLSFCSFRNPPEGTADAADSPLISTFLSLALNLAPSRWFQGLRHPGASWKAVGPLQFQLQDVSFSRSPKSLLSALSEFH